MRRWVPTTPQVRVHQAWATLLCDAGLLGLCALFAPSRADQRILQRAFEQSAGKFGEQVGSAILEQAATEFVNWLLGPATPTLAPQGVVRAPQFGLTPSGADAQPPHAVAEAEAPVGAGENF